MAAVPLVVPWTTTPIDLGQVVSIVNENRFVRRLQVYPELQPGLLNPTELDPCNDWGDGAEVALAQRLVDLDAMISDKVELVVAGQIGGDACPGLVQIFEHSTRCRPAVAPWPGASPSIRILRAGHERRNSGGRCRLDHRRAFGLRW